MYILKLLQQQIFSDRQQYQGVKISQHFRDRLSPNLQGATDDCMSFCPEYIPVSSQASGWTDGQSHKVDEVALAICQQLYSILVEWSSAAMFSLVWIRPLCWSFLDLTLSSLLLLLYSSCRWLINLCVLFKLNFVFCVSYMFCHSWFFWLAMA
jgi:hypothetical protein